MERYFSADLLHGKAALITGGGTGIGRGIALALAAHGCDVAIASRRRDHLDPTVRDLEAVLAGLPRRGARSARSRGLPRRSARSARRRAVGLAADVRDSAAIERVVEEVVRSFGRLDIVVNGAAGNFVCLAEDLSPNGFAAVIDIDLKGTFHVSKAALPHLKRQGGTVLNISATLHYVGTAAQLHVSAAKAGIDALTRTLAVEWGPYGIRVNGIAPGPVAETEGARRLLQGDLADRLARATPLGRIGRIDDVAQAAVFLCSDAASFINGVTIAIDGGLWLASSRLGEIGSAARPPRG